MKLHNTLSREVEKFEPIDARLVRIYSCGPTVYDHIHIGNLSSFIFADTLRRVVMASGYKVKHVMNFTDVDDKTIRRSQEKYADLAPIEVLMKLTSEYSGVFLDDMKAVGNNVDAIDFVKATDSIDSMRTLIKELHEAGFAYVADDGIYFSIDKYRKSGKKYGQLTEITASSTSEARIQNDEYDKESVHDFALWKKQKTNEPAWPFELDGQDLAGRPGWHIECSAMSSGALGQPFDIHTGGVDLMFPHHENEIAQSTATKDDPTYAKYFAHNEHLLIDGNKMSKSLDNFYTLEDIRQKGFDPLAFRLLVLQAHYRKQAHFTWDNLEAAQNRLFNLYTFADLKHQPNAMSDVIEEQAYEGYEKFIDGQITDLGNDLDTPIALSSLSTYTRHIASKGYRQGIQAFLEALDRLYGLELSTRPDITDEQKQVIAERDKAKSDGDWQKSDELRDQLTDQGIGLRDTSKGAIWSRLRTR
ncbi:MAG: cysteine--tRNA ligase [Patescibacteria group bacterium]